MSQSGNGLQVTCRDFTVGGCIAGSGPGSIVQNCAASTGILSDVQISTLANLTSDAVAGVLNDHQLPSSDESLVLGYARDSVRSYLMAKLTEVITKQDRSAEEQGVVDLYQNAVRDLRVR